LLQATTALHSTVACLAEFGLRPSRAALSLQPSAAWPTAKPISAHGNTGSQTLQIIIYRLQIFI